MAQVFNNMRETATTARQHFCKIESAATTNGQNDPCRFNRGDGVLGQRFQIRNIGVGIG
jgi:hypothetical protein